MANPRLEYLCMAQIADESGSGRELDTSATLTSGRQGSQPQGPHRADHDTAYGAKQKSERRQSDEERKQATRQRSEFLTSAIAAHSSASGETNRRHLCGDVARARLAAAPAPAIGKTRGKK